MFENIHNLGFEKMVVFDTETTGFTPSADCIIELAALCIPLNINGEPVIIDQMDEYISLEKGRKLPSKIIELTGITDEMLATEGKPRDEVAKRFGDMIRGGPTLLVAHNAQFDGEFARYLLAGQSFPDGLHWLDSMTIFKDRRPYPHKLESAIRAYGLEGKVQNSHRAIDDAMALYEEKKEQVASENLIEFPEYVYPSVKAKLEELHIAALPNLSELFGNKPGTYSEFRYADSRYVGGNVTGIEMVKKPTASQYACNVGILHEIGHALNGSRERLRTTYRREVNAWQTAEKLRDEMGFPCFDEATGEAWEDVKRKCMATYEAVRITSGDIWRYILKVTKWTIIVIAIAMVLAVVLADILSADISFEMLFWFVLRGCLPITILLSCLACLALTIPGITLIAKANGLTAEEFVHLQIRRLKAQQNDGRVN